MTLKPQQLPLFIVLAALAACTPESKIPACSTSYPTGTCDSGKACFQGACVDAASLCSPANLAGTCAAGTTCFSGGCVLTSGLCSTTAPTGPCENGKTCVEGTCFASSSLCSTSNLAGSCPSGKTCQAGLCAAPLVDPCSQNVSTTQPTIGVDTRANIVVDGLHFKDSSGDGQLQPYEDWRKLPLCRAKDLTGRLSMDEKIALMSETTSVGDGNVSADVGIPDAVRAAVVTGHVRQALIRLGTATAPHLATYLNALQKVAEAQPWGIPVVITTDPSHGISLSVNATSGVQSIVETDILSAWPMPMGLGAAKDVTLSKLYGDTLRREMSAIGFRWHLGPMADLSTEPRWPRVQNVFGSNAYAVAAHTRAVIEGMQGSSTGDLRTGVAATMKHFPGHGAEIGGMDAHGVTGKYTVYPGGMFTYHQIPFQAAIDVGVASVMPCYAIFKDQIQYEPEQTSSAFSKTLVTDYLKKTMGFSGMVTTDWGVMSFASWGVEALTMPQRGAMLLKAGSDQIGFDSSSSYLDAYTLGLVTAADIDASVVKILEMHFKLGIFENPYVDPAAAEVGSAANRTAGFIAQKKAIVIASNKDHTSPPCSGISCLFLPPGAAYLPITGASTTDDTNNDGTISVWFDGVTNGLTGGDKLDRVLDTYDYTAPAASGSKAIVAAASPATADIAILRIAARSGTYFGSTAGTPLSFDAPMPDGSFDSNLAPAAKSAHQVIDLLRVRDGYTNSAGVHVAAANPTLKIILVMYAARPGILEPFMRGLTTLDETAGVAGSYPLVSNPANLLAAGGKGVDGVLVEFGAYDRAVLDVVFNKNVPTSPVGYKYGGALPTEFPSSDSDVNAQFEDVPDDTSNPTFPAGTGSTY